MTPIYKIMIFLKRREGLSLEEFRDYYENHHVPLCRQYMTGVTRYVRHYPLPVTSEFGDSAELGFDVITELRFADSATFEMVLKYGSRGQLPVDVLADEERLFDRSKTRYTAVLDCETVVS